MNTEIQKAGEASVVRDEMLTKQELAERLKISVRTVEQWQHDGHLPFIKRDGVLRFYWPDVVSHLRANFTVRRGETVTPAGEVRRTE